MLYRDSWIEIDVDSLKENIQEIKNISNKELVAVIKANGYGSDDYTVGQVALEAGVKMLAVSSLDEAMSLRKRGITADILILGYVQPQYASLLRENNLITTAVSLDWVKEFIEYDCKECRIHLKIDSGMHRLGMTMANEVVEAIELLKENHVCVEGIFTHFACSDNHDNVHTNKQYSKFSRLVHDCNIPFKWIHCSNSDATVHYKEDLSNITRCGLAMFGLSSYDVPLKPVMSLKSKVISVKKIKKGDYVGYGYHYQAQKDEFIAVIPLGYADGFSRKNEGRKVSVGCKSYEIVGRICMDQCMIRVDESISVGDEVEIFGKQIPITSMSEELDTIPYEIMTALTDRLTKKIVIHHQVIKIVNSRFEY